MKKLISGVLGVLFIMGLAACGNIEIETISTSKGTIGYLCYDMKSEFYQSISQGIQESAQKAGYVYTVCDQRGNDKNMVSGCIQLIQDGIDALILTAYKPEDASPIIDAARSNNIPIIMVDYGSDLLDYDALVESDHVKGGEMAANYAMDRLITKESSKKAAIITNDTSAGSYVRRDGFYNTMISAGFEIVAEENADSNKELAKSSMAKILDSYPDVGVVFCLNDVMAMGAVEAIEAAGLEAGKDIKVLGFDAIDSVDKFIQSGEISCSIKQNPYEMGVKSVDCAMKLLAGEKISFDDEYTKTIYTGIDVVEK